MGVTRRMRCKHLPTKLRQIRDALDLSQRELLRRLGFQDHFERQNVSSWERPSDDPDNTEPPLPVLLAYAREVGVRVEVLIDDKLKLPKELPVKKRHKAQD
jgi:transcriptional regulator with XRE-family HTH domain